MKQTENHILIIKIALSIMLLICLFDMPYGYYQFVRFIALIGFGLLSFYAKENKKDKEMVVYGALAILFQPFFKISLGRELWNIVDVIVAVGLIFSIYKHEKSKNGKKL